MTSKIFTITLVVEPNNCHAFVFRGQRANIYHLSQNTLSWIADQLQGHSALTETVAISKFIASRTDINYRRPIS